MTQITVSQDKLEKVLTDMEVLINDVASLFDQDKIVKKRLADIKADPSISKSEEELNDYLKKRGIKGE